ncbi:MAG TPA: DUF4340 domain-containing protein [Cyclobacteriaceae bacterium]|nr:DUF4340 domain-containing protein [Cyclobacteriaceae bacterium]
MKKINNKILAISLVVLVGVFVVARLVRAPKLEGNLRKELVNIDRTKVTEVRIASRDSLVTLVKENDKWNIVRGEKKIEADSAAVSRLLQTIQLVEATRMASRKKDKWAGFKVDSTGTNISVYYGGDKEADFIVGSFGFNQTPGNGGIQGGQGIAAYTYVRLADEDEVYIVDGFLGASVPSGTKDWAKKPASPTDSTLVN